MILTEQAILSAREALAGRGKIYPRRGEDPNSTEFKIARIARNIEFHSNGCWVWTGKRLRGSYGLVAHGGARPYAHRFVFEIVNGPIGEGIFICHSCDNPPCVNPAHLFAGTHSDNMRDCVRKSRHRPAGGDRKLGPGEIREIRTALKASEQKASIARRFGVSQTVIGDIASGKIWSCVPEEAGA